MILLISLPEACCLFHLQLRNPLYLVYKEMMKVSCAFSMPFLFTFQCMRNFSVFSGLCLDVTSVYKLGLLTLYLDCPTCDDFEALLETVEDLKNKVRWLKNNDK